MTSSRHERRLHLPKNVAASAYNFTNDGTTASFTVAIFQGGYTKANHIELTDSGGGSSPRWSVPNTGAAMSSAPDSIFTPLPGANNQSVATSDGGAGYGTKSLNLCQSLGQRRIHRRHHRVRAEPSQ